MSSPQSVWALIIGVTLMVVSSVTAQATKPTLPLFPHDLSSPAYDPPDCRRGPRKNFLTGSCPTSERTA